MHIDFVQRKVKETKALPVQRDLHCTQVRAAKEMVVKAEQWVQKYYCVMLLWKGIIILNYILIFSCIIIIAVSDENRCNEIIFFFLLSMGNISFSYTNLQQLEGCSAEVPKLSSLVVKSLGNRVNIKTFLFSHFQSWLPHEILRIWIILSS